MFGNKLNILSKKKKNLMFLKHLIIFKLLNLNRKPGFLLSWCLAKRVNKKKIMFKNFKIADTLKSVETLNINYSNSSYIPGFLLRRCSASNAVMSLTVVNT